MRYLRAFTILFILFVWIEAIQYLGVNPPTLRIGVNPPRPSRTSYDEK
jgi:hypothetical protein